MPDNDDGKLPSNKYKGNSVHYGKSDEDFSPGIHGQAEQVPKVQQDTTDNTSQGEMLLPDKPAGNLFKLVLDTGGARLALKTD